MLLMIKMIKDGGNEDVYAEDCFDGKDENHGKIRIVKNIFT